MRRLAAMLLLMLACTMLSAVTYPYDRSVGLVGEGSELVRDALSRPFSLEWVETYVDEAYRKDFSALHSPLLSRLLPLDDFILSREDDGRIMARERMDGRVYTIFLSQEGLIMALQI